MKELIDTLLLCPNLSLRILDSTTGRTVKTVTTEQLQQYFNQRNASCGKDCDNMICPNKTE